MAIGRTKKKAERGMTPRRWKRQDFDAVYYMGVQSWSGGENPPPPVTQALVTTYLC